MISPLIIITLNIILYFPTIFYGLVMDDEQHYRNMKQSGWMNKHTKLYLRIAERLYGGGTFGFNTKIDHSFTLFLWTSLCVLIYYAFGHNTVALATACLVSTNPMMNQLSIWLNGRRFLICAILLMLCLIITNSYPYGYVLAAPLYLASSIFQVSIFFTPILFLYKSPWTFMAIGVLLLLMWKWITVKIESRLKFIPCNDLRKWHPKRPIVIIKLFGFYFWRMLIPQRVSMVYPFLQLWGRTKEGNEDAYSTNLDFYYGVVAICLCGAAGIFIPGTQLKFYFLFMVLSVLQWCAIIPVVQLVSDRYASISQIFMCFFISYFSLKFHYGFFVVAFLLGLNIAFTKEVFFMYKDITAWYDYHVFDDFSNLAVVNLRVGLLLGEKKLWQAQALLENSLSYHPKDYALNYLAYVSCMIVGALPLAKKYLDACKDNYYIGEEKERSKEVEDADLGLQVMMGNSNIKIPDHMKKKG